MKKCHICKTEKNTEKQKVLVELSHKTPFPLQMTVEVCQECTEVLSSAGIPRVKGTKLVIPPAI